MKIKSKQLEENLGSESSPFTSVHSSDFAGSLTGPIRFKAKNETGGSVAKGVPVYINGVSGDVPTIALADSDTTNMPCVGLTESASNNNAEVHIVSFGNLTGLNTAALGTGIVGDTVYISTTAGTLTLTPPAGSSSKLQNIGQVIREHATEGIIKVGGAGRTAATPNLDQGKIFIGNASNQSSASVYTLPIADGTNGQVLTTNGSGAVTFQTPSSGSSDSLSIFNYGRTVALTDYTGGAVNAYTVDGALNGQGYAMPFGGYIRSITIAFDCTSHSSNANVIAHLPGYLFVGASVTVTGTGDYSAVWTNTSTSSPYSFSAGDTLNVNIRHTATGLTTANHAITLGVVFSGV